MTHTTKFSLGSRVRSNVGQVGTIEAIYISAIAIPGREPHIEVQYGVKWIDEGWAFSIAEDLLVFQSTPELAGEPREG